MRLRAARTGIVCLGILAGVVSGCAKERDPINRVQSNALAKNFFVGENLRDPADDPEFRMKSFNVGGTVGQSDYTIGEYSALDRVRWEITENLLIARKAYEVAPGADNRGTPKSDWDQKRDDKTLVKTPNGAIVAAYKILSHFDIRRAYNTTTGEELNVVEENTSDRAWYDREYMRVDWTQNIVDGPNDPTKFFSDRLGGPATPVAYTAAAPDADDAPHIEVEDGYFDVTNKFTVEPETMQFPWGTIKKCQLVAFFTGSSSFDCNAQEAVVRLSFAKVKPDEDFEAFEDSVAWHDVVGNMGGDGDAAQLSFGSAPRNGWDPQYGYTDNLTKRYKNIHEIFEASHQAARCDSDADADKNGTADACENGTTGYKGHAGSRCDVAVGKCTIPVRDREVKTMGYWFNQEAPDALQDEVDPATNKPTSRGALEDLTYSWNQLLEVSLAYRREVECRATGDGDRDSCHAEFFDGTGPNSKVMVSFGNWLIDKVKAQSVDKGKPIMVACHNPVRSYDPEDPCGKPGAKARLGDQRKNFLAYWPFDSRAPYGGVAGVTPDPITGEIRGASATIMGRSATYAAALQRDIIQIALGDLKVDDVLKGVPADRYASLVKSGSLAAPGLKNALPPGELERRASMLDYDALRRATGSTITSGMSDRDRAIASARVASKTDTDTQALLSLLAKTDALTSKIHDFELQMLDKSMVAAALGTDPSVSQTPDLKALASPLHGLDPMRVDAMRAMYQQSLAARGACFDESMASGPGSVYLASLAGYFKQKYGGLDPVERGKRIYDDLWKEAVKGIGLHELGHSLGLRHNFASSWDAPNYNPQYWQLRTGEGAASNACDGTQKGDGDKCMGPRYRDPMTADEQGVGPESRPAIDYFANTSTMEYQLERFGETVGLGTYDLHAMKTLYGRVIETFDDKVMPTREQKAFAFQNFTQRTERTFVDENAAHYTNAARAMKVFDKARDCRPATEEEKAIGGWRIVHGEVCAPPPKDHWAFDAFETSALVTLPDGTLDGIKWHVKDRDGKDRVRWHYRYGEQYGSGGFYHAMMGDSGADAYELVQNLTQKFDLTYPWAYFRRQNREFLSFSLPQAISSQYFARARTIHSQLGRDLAEGNPMRTKNDDDLGPAVAAQTDLLGFMQKIILMPEPGSYARVDTLKNGLALYDIAGTGRKGEFSLDISEGRFLGEDFDEGKGGSWDYQKFVSRAGFDVEKSLAMMQLIDPRPTVFSVSRENFLDERNPMVSFRTDLPNAVDQLVGGILAEDWGAIAPAVDDPKAPIVTPADLSTTTLDRSPSARVLFPNIGYTQQLQLAIYTAVFSRLSQDMTVIEKMRIWVDGDRAPTIPGARQVKFVDPQTGFTYMANRFDEQVSGRAVDRGIASRMIEHANDLLAGGKTADLQKYVGFMNAVRQISRALGEGPLGGSPGGGGDDESSR